MSKIEQVHIVVQIEKSCIEHINVFTNATKASSFFRGLISSRLDGVKRGVLKEIVEDGFYREEDYSIELLTLPLLQGARASPRA